MQVDIPERLAFLFEPWRFKVAWGGRDGAKSWSFAQALLAIGIMKTTRVLCAREVQKSIRQSVHQTLADAINRLELHDFYRVMDFEIRSKVNDTLFVYDGLAAHTVDSIKSYESIDVCWVEEGQSVGDRSWDILIPTIRKPGSEIWVSMNPKLKSDPAYERFVETKRPDCKAVHITYRDNPWSSKEMREERARARERMDEETFDNVWEGLPKGVLDGAIYGEQVQHMRKVGRIGKVPFRPRLRLNAFLDLGTSIGNATAVWLHQQHGTQHLFPHYMAEHGKGMAYWWDQMEQVRRKHGLEWGVIYMPHDGRANLQGAEVTDRVEILERLIARDQVACKVETVPRVQHLGAAIDLTREKMADAWIDEDGGAEGIKALEHYQYKWDPERKVFLREPLHNWASNGADAFRQWATGYREPEMPRPPRGEDYPGEMRYVRGGY